jgi:hypothetical protein
VTHCTYNVSPFKHQSFSKTFVRRAPGACTASRAWRDWLPAADGCSSAIYQVAQVYAVRHEVDKAFEWLQIAFENHDGSMPGLLVDPLLGDLRDEPRYMAMLKKVGLPGS